MASSASCSVSGARMRIVCRCSVTSRRNSAAGSRVAADESGELRGIVERVATGLKQRFRGAAEISRIIGDVVAVEREKKR